MPTREECLNHIQRTVDMLYHFEEFEDAAFVEALALEIQVKKREERLAGTVDGNLRKYFAVRGG